MGVCFSKKQAPVFLLIYLITIFTPSENQQDETNGFIILFGRDADASCGSSGEGQYKSGSFIAESVGITRR
jgi:hypothetical protein